MKLHLIPDVNRINDTMTLCEKWDLAFEYDDFFTPSLLDNAEALKHRIRRYKELNRPSGVDTLHGVFFDICANSSDEQIARISKKRMFSSMEIAAELGCKGVVFHTNLIPGFESDFYLQGWLDCHVSLYSELLDRFRGIDIYVENMFDYKPDMLVKLAECMAGREGFGICYDVAHGHIHDLSMEEWIKPLSPYVRHLHINDNDGRTDLHQSVGAGTIDWDKYFSMVNEYMPQASMLIEVGSIERQIESLQYMHEHGWI